ncbi:uncharacterized protein LOC135370613 [Ornithodoros turicata]|uniref:uncharacterized protein LOC135370613 n=1 Tax=Ornithodoros turicata TaxID=34597 RepID=UPI0031392348
MAKSKLVQGRVETVKSEAAKKPEQAGKVWTARRLSWRAVLVAIPTVMVGVMISIFLTPNRTRPVVGYSRSRALYTDNYSACKFKYATERPIICVYEKDRISPRYTPEDIPAHLCRHIVFCCVQPVDRVWKPTDVESVQSFSYRLVRHMPSSIRYLGIGGRDANYTALNQDTATTQDRETFIENVIDFGTSMKFTGGIAYVLLEPSRMGQGRALQKLVQRTLRRQRNRNVIVLLPRRAATVFREFSAPLFSEKHLIMVQLTHALSSSMTRFATCSSPYKKPSSHVPHSMETTYRYLKGRYGKDWDVVERGLVVTFSLAWLRCRLVDSTDGSPGASAVCDGSVRYRDVCKSNGTVYDPRSDCEYTRQGTFGWMSGLGMTSGAFFKAHPKVRGFAVFDLDHDDYEGECVYHKHPLLQTLYDSFHDVLL